MYWIKVITYEGVTGGYRSFDDTTFDTQAIAVARAKELAKETGKCYGVFGPDGKVHDTSSYFAAYNLPELD